MFVISGCSWFGDWQQRSERKCFVPREYRQAVLLWKQLHRDADLYDAFKRNPKGKSEKNVPSCAERVCGFGAGASAVGVLPAFPLAGLTTS